MTTLGKHLPALLVLGIVAGFLGALTAIGAITGHYAVTVLLAVLAVVGTALGFKIGATAAASTTPAPVPAPKPAPAPAPVVPIQPVPVAVPPTQ